MQRAVVAVAGLVLFSATVHGQWAQWRGPARDGVVPAASVPAAWPEKLSLSWRQAVGEGYSSPVVNDGRVYVLSRNDPDEIVSAFELESGKSIWRARYPSSFTKNQYATAMSKGPFSTPLVAGGRVFTLGVSGVLSSFDAADGALKWRKDWSKEIDTSKLFTGTAMSPIIDSGLLIVHVGDDTKGAFRAFDPATGAEKWSLPGHGPGYASPVVFGTVNDARHFVTMTDKAFVGLDVATGKLLWQIPFPDEWNENIVTPVFAGDVVIISGTRKGTFGYRLEVSDRPDAAAGVAQRGRADVHEHACCRWRIYLRILSQAEGTDLLSRQAHRRPQVGDRGPRGNERRHPERRPQSARAHNRR